MAAAASNLIAFRPVQAATTSRGDFQVSFTGQGTAALDQVASTDPQRQALTIAVPQTAIRTVPLMDFGDALRLRYPLFVTIEQSDNAIVAASYDLEIAEHGETEFAALDNFKLAVAELYIALTTMGADAPHHLASKRRFLEALAL